MLVWQLRESAVLSRASCLAIRPLPTACHQPRATLQVKLLVDARLFDLQNMQVGLAARNVYNPPAALLCSLKA